MKQSSGEDTYDQTRNLTLHCLIYWLTFSKHQASWECNQRGGAEYTGNDHSKQPGGVQFPHSNNQLYESKIRLPRNSS